MHPITDVLARTAEGHIPSAAELGRLGLPPRYRYDLEVAVAKVEHDPDLDKATSAAERLISHLPSGYERDDYLDDGGESLGPRDLAARLPQS